MFGNLFFFFFFFLVGEQKFRGHSDENEENFTVIFKKLKINFGVSTLNDIFEKIKISRKF